MEVTFDKTIQVSLDFDPKRIGELAILSYDADSESLDDNWDGQIHDDIYDYVGDSIYYFLEEDGLSREDREAMEDMDCDVTEDLIKAVNEYIKENYNIKPTYEDTDD